MHPRISHAYATVDASIGTMCRNENFIDKAIIGNSTDPNHGVSEYHKTRLS